MTLLCRHFVTSDIRRLRKTLTYLLILLRNTATIDKLVFSIFMGGGDSIGVAQWPCKISSQLASTILHIINVHVMYVITFLTTQT